MQLDPRLADALEAFVAAVDAAERAPEDAGAQRLAEQRSAMVAVVARQALDAGDDEGDVLRTLLTLEHTHLAPPPEGAPDGLLAADFTEIGASGRRITRAEALATIRNRAGRDEGLHLADPSTRALADDVWALTYDLVAEASRTRRTSVWRRRGPAWELTLHQGTPVPDP